MHNQQIRKGAENAQIEQCVSMVLKLKKKHSLPVDGNCSLQLNPFASKMKGSSASFEISLKPLGKLLFA